MKTFEKVELSNLCRMLTVTALAVTSLVIFNPVSAQRQLVDDFSGETIDFTKWKDFGTDSEFQRLVRTDPDAGNVVLRTDSDGTRFAKSRLQAAVTNAASLEAMVTIESISREAETTNDAYASVEGIFYNKGANPEDLTGDVFVATRIGDRGKGLEAWWVCQSSNDPDFNTFDEVTDDIIPPGTLQIGVPYSIKVEYDGDQTFVFSVDGISSEPLTGPDRGGDAFSEFRGLGSTILEGGGLTSIHATADDVILDDAGVYDSFTTAPLDASRWNASFSSNGDDFLEHARFVEHGELQLDAQGTGSRATEDIYLKEINPDYIEGRVTITSDSQVESGGSGRTRITGYFFNVRRGPGSGQDYDGADGDVWARILLQLDDGVLTANAYAETEFANYDPDEQLLFEQFTKQLQLGQEYMLAIQRDNNKLTFTLDDEVIEYEYPGVVYEPSTDAALGGYRRLVNRVQPGAGMESGYLKSRWSAVYIGGPNTPPLVSDSAISTGQDMVSSTLSATDENSFDELTYALETNGTMGAVTIDDAATGAFSYTPNSGATGTDTFTWKANDGTDDSAMATVTVTINDASPTLNDVSPSIGVGGDGGGCALGNGRNGFDPMLPAMVLLSLGYLIRRRRLSE